MYQQNAVMTTSHQINTLLAYLKTHTAPPEGMLFFNQLVNAKLDGTPESIDRLSQLFTKLQGYLTQKNTTLERLVSQPQSRLFFLTVAGYLGDYLAKRCDEPVTWYSYFEARTEIDKKNRAYGTDFELAQAFENSVVARIGDNMYCQPLKAVQVHLMGQGDISEFVAHMTQGIFEQAQVNIMAQPNKVCHAYLRKVQTGRLLDSTFGFFEQLKTLDFDYSEASLAKLDSLFAQIKQQYQLNTDSYQSLIVQPAYQATLYLLGFYIGMTCAKLTEQPVIWANYQQIYRSLIYANPNAKLVDSIEHSFVMVVENGQENRFVTPILVVTQSLFGINRAEDPLDFLTSTAFYDMFKHNFADQNRLALQYFPYPMPDPTATHSVQLPKLWQIAVQSASRLVTNSLMQIFDGSELEPQVFELDPMTKKGTIYPFANLGKMTASDYLKKNPKQSLILVTSQDTLINLPSGQSDAIAIDIAVYHEPKLRLRLVLPYRPAESTAGFAIYPLIVANKALQADKVQQEAMLTALVAHFYQSATRFVSPLHEADFWQHYYIEPVNSTNTTPLRQQMDAQQAEKVTLTILPVAPLEVLDTATTQSASAVTPVLQPTVSTSPADSQTLNPLPVSQPVLPDILPMQTPAPSALANQFYNQSPTLPIKTSPSPQPSDQSISQASDQALTTAQTVTLKQKAQISPELLAKLRQDQERLKSQLSTNDGEKDRKIMLMVGSIVIVLVLLMLGVWVMK